MCFSILETLQPLFAIHSLFTVFQHRFETDLGEVHFGKRKRSLVLLRDGPVTAYAGGSEEVESYSAINL